MTIQESASGPRARRAQDTLANRLVLVRRELGISQREAALATNLTYGEWQSIESGREARGLNTKVAKIALALGYDRDWLMWGGPLGDGSGLPPVDSNHQPAGNPPSRWLVAA